MGLTEAFEDNRNSLIIMMVGTALGTLAVAFYLLYHTAFEEQRARLTEKAESRAAMINAVARFDMAHSGSEAFSDTLGQIIEAHENFEGFGETGEFTLAQKIDDEIVFLLSHRHHDLSNPQPVPINGHLAEPMRRALKGESGSALLLDYRGEKVLAAYHPVGVYGLGVVAKIDLAEIRAPFIRAGMLSFAAAGTLILIGSALFLRITRHIGRQLSRSERLFRNTFNHAGVGIAHLTPEGKFIRVNSAFHQMLGYKPADLIGLHAWKITVPEEQQQLRLAIESLNSEMQLAPLQELRCITREDEQIATTISLALMLNSRKEADYIIVIVTDLRERIALELELQESLVALQEKNDALQEAISTIKTISGIVPLCAWCGSSIQDEGGDWVKLDQYLVDHTDAKVSHGMCPDCLARMQQQP